MPKVIFENFDGGESVIVAAEGLTLMEVARDAGLAGIKAECGGACACSTCHVYIAPEWIDRLPPREPMEEDMLDFAPARDESLSRLSCQIKVTADLEGLRLRFPAEQA